MNVTVEMQNTAHISALQQVCDQSAQMMKSVCLAVSIINAPEDEGMVFTMTFAFETQASLDAATPVMKSKVRDHLRLVAPDALIKMPVAVLETEPPAVATAGIGSETLLMLATIMVLHLL